MITKETHPLGFDRYKNWIKVEAKSKMAVTDDHLDSIVTDDLVKMSMTRASRDLYDFFDAIGIIVSVWHDGSSWKYRVDDNIFPTTANVGGGRKDTEQRAFEDAFNRIEKK